MCGKTTWGNGGALKRGKKISCGCKRGHTFNFKSRVYVKKEKVITRETVARKVRQAYQGNAKRRGMEFQLNDQMVYDLIFLPCHYCGNEPRPCGLGMNRNGIDRYYNSVGYLPENCVTCCSVCNFMKKVLDGPDFLSHINQIQKFRDLQNIHQ